jgi:hypothetical protein
MKKINLIVCALVVCLLSACLDRWIYTWRGTNLLLVVLH